MPIASVPSQLSQILARGTYDADWYPGATYEQKVQNAINAAAADGAARVLVHQSYDASLVAFNTAVQMVVEGGDWSKYDVRAYGAICDGVSNDSAEVQAAVSAVPITGGNVVGLGKTCILGSTVVLPVDRMITISGDGDLGTNSGGLASKGTAFKRLSTFVSGPLFSQAATPYGVHVNDIVLDGNNVAGDLFALDNVQNFRFTRVTFFNSNGNGLLMTTCFNWFLDQCKWFEVGNNTAYPNGKSSIAMLSSANGGCGQGWITQPHFESGRGSYITSYDSIGTKPHFGICILGGKAEWTGNAVTGFAPAAASALGMPFIVPGNSNDWTAVGFQTIGGYHTLATHWFVTNCSRLQLLGVTCEMPSGFLDNQNPRFFVDLFSGNDITVQGTFYNGASVGAGAGAQIRVIESSVTGYTISDTNRYVSPINGVGIVYTNPTTGKSSVQRKTGAIHDKVFVVNPAVAGQALNAADGDNQEFNITTNIAVVVAAPSNTPAANQSQDLTVTFFNTSGGALGTAPTFAAGAGAFLLSAAVVNPGNNTGVSYTFRWSPTAIGGARYREISRTVAF